MGTRSFFTFHSAEDLANLPQYVVIKPTEGFSSFCLFLYLYRYMTHINAFSLIMQQIQEYIGGFFKPRRIFNSRKQKTVISAIKSEWCRQATMTRPNLGYTQERK